MSLKNSNATKIHKLLKDNLKNRKINQIYKSFENTLNIKENFAVAVSGGPDSLALAFLAKIYSIRNKVKSKFFIVDHRLRNESAKEAKKVKKVLKDVYIDAEILSWSGKKPLNNIQSLARQKRYELIFNRCDKFKIKNILLGHHQDDLLENFFIRILRGSGLKGLVSLDKKSKSKNKNLLRPLLNQKKDDLIFISKKVFNFYVEDRSNQNEKFQRIKIRKLILELQNNGLDKEKFLKTIKNLKLSNEVVNFYVKKNLKKNTTFLVDKKKMILNMDFFRQPHDVIFRSLSESIKLIGQKYYSPRGKKIDKIINDVINYPSFKATLGSCVIEKVNQTVIISEEY